MERTVVKIENVSKSYQLGTVGYHTLSSDLKRWWYKLRKKENQLGIIGEEHKGIPGRKHWALKNLNLEIKEGEVIGFIGKNGAGKSTMLKILSKVTLPSEGQITIEGRVASLLEVGTGFHPELTGKENIFLNGAILGMNKKEVNAKLDEIIDFSGVGKFIDTPVKRYSSGMYVRLAFAVAAHLEPEILIVDEVLAVGDAEFRKKCIGKMKDVASKGRTVLFVSHNLAAVKSICTRCVYIESGEIKEIGEPSKVIGSYLNNSNAVNGFEVNWKEDDRKGDDYAVINAVRLVNRESETIKLVQPTTNFGIEISYEILKEGKFPIPKVHLLDESGEKIFGTVPGAVSAFSEEIGTHKCVVWFPKDMLNCNLYTLAFGLITWGEENGANYVHTDFEAQLDFEVVENRDSATLSPNKFAVNGSLRPLLNWEKI